MTTDPFDMDAETFRRNYGWFGEPWDSETCYDMEDGTIHEDMRIPTPVGELCHACEGLFQEGDQGKAKPLEEDRTRITYTHMHCLPGSR